MTSLTQRELDSLLQNSLPALLVRASLADLDTRRLSLGQAENDFLCGEPLTFLVIDAAGVVRFQHNSLPADPFAARLLNSCDEQLTHERRMVLQPLVVGFDASPALASAGHDLPSPLPPVATPVLPLVNDSLVTPDEWLTREELAKKANIRLKCVSEFAKKNHFASRMSGRANIREYAAPLGFVYKPRPKPGQ